ncbi:MAG: hypothetical protein IJ356_06925 [Erysipelotrichaceae bacterium]|nr:hypothetical protein [Erysipelotrichaceae bacterium]
MSFITPFLWLISSAFVLVILTGKKFESVLPLTFIFGVFCFYIGGLFGKVSFGMIACVIFSLLLIPLLFIKRKQIKSISCNLFTIGFVVFTLFYVYFNLYHRFTAFATWDEFQHWGPMIKETMRLDSFYSVFESTLQTHKDYPPFISLLEALWCNLCGGYSEAYCYRALSVFTVSLFMPAFAKLNFSQISDWIHALFYSGAIVLVNLISFVLLETCFTTIYIDFILGLFSAYMLYLVVSTDGKLSYFNCINLGVSLTFLIMIKQMSIAFYAMSLFLLGGLILLKKHKTTWKQGVLAFGMMIVLPLVISKSWEIYNLPFELGWQFKISELSISDFLNLVFNAVGEAWQVEALNNYLEAIVHRPLITAPFALTYWQLSACLTVAIFVVFMCFTKDKLKSAFVSLTYVIGTIGYAVTMLMLYTYSFGSYEGPMLASFERYINTYIYLGFCFVLMCYFWLSSSCKTKKTYISDICILLVLSLLCGKGFWRKLEIQTSYTGYMMNPTYTSIFGQMESTLDEGDSVLVVSQYVDITVQILKYKYPEYSFRSVTLGMPKYNGDAYSTYYTLDNWKALVSQYDYIYLYNTDHSFYQDYWIPVTDLEMYNLNLYQIKDSGFCLVAPDGQYYE